MKATLTARWIAAAGALMVSRVLLAGGACNDYGCTSGGYDSNAQRQKAVEGAVSGLGDYLQNNADRQAEQERRTREAEDAREAAQQESARKRTAQFDQYVNQMGGDDWEAEAARQAGASGTANNQPSVAADCNCRKVTGSCRASLSGLKKNGKTGYSVRVSSSEAQCSRVTWYIDNMPQLTVLNRTASTLEQISSQKTLTPTNLEIDRCEVCARQ